MNRHRSQKCAINTHICTLIYDVRWTHKFLNIKKTLPEGIFQPLHKRRDINLIRMSDFASMSDTILKGEHGIWRGANQGVKYTPHPASL